MSELVYRERTSQEKPKTKNGIFDSAIETKKRRKKIKRGEWRERERERESEREREGGGGGRERWGWTEAGGRVPRCFPHFQSNSSCWAVLGGNEKKESLSFSLPLVVLMKSYKNLEYLRFVLFELSSDHTVQHFVYASIDLQILLSFESKTFKSK